ncbi:putative structural protein [Serratia phage vB_SmaM_Haymo]|nr:putative structural protein [Serratia phage vB_SmaM_Haymo]
MSEYQKKITELPAKATVGENDVFPTADKNDTSKVTLNQIRESIWFKNAFPDLASGIAGTEVDGVFYVFTDDSKLNVNEYIRTSGGAVAIQDADGNPVRLPTSNLISYMGTELAYGMMPQVNSFDLLRKLKPINDGFRIVLRAYYEDNTAGGGEFIGRIGTAKDNGGTIAAGTGYYWQRVDSTELTPEMFGAYGDGQHDDDRAVQSALNVVQNKDVAIIDGKGNYRFGAPIKIFGFGKGLNLKLRTITTNADKYTFTDWKTASPLIQIGDASNNGSMVGLNINIDWVDGGSVADVVQVVNYGCGGSHIHIERMINVVNGVSTPGIKFPSSSVMITGGYWSAGLGQGIRIGKVSAANTYTNEGWIVDVNFITGFRMGGIYSTNGGMFLNIRGQSDFCGRFLSRVSFDTSTGLNAGDSVTFNDKVYEVIAAYQKVKGTFSLLLNEGVNVSSVGSSFKVGDTVTIGANTLTVTEVLTPGTSNWYPDVIHDYYNSAGMGRCKIDMPYCGGVEGSFLYSSDIWCGNSDIARPKQMLGHGYTHSGTIATWWDTYLNRQIMDVNDSYIAPYRHLNMRTNRIFGVEVYKALAKVTTSAVRTFAKAGDGTVPSVREKWVIEYTGTLMGVYGKYEVYVGNSSLELVKIYADNIVTLSISGMTINAVQGAQDTLITTFNLQRIF